MTNKVRLVLTHLSRRKTVPPDAIARRVYRPARGRGTNDRYRAFVQAGDDAEAAAAPRADEEGAGPLCGGLGEGFRMSLNFVNRSLRRRRR
jgi:hypothetical protein